MEVTLYGSGSRGLMKMGKELRRKCMSMRNSRLFSIQKSIQITHHVSKLKGKNHMNNSLDVEKAFEKFNTPSCLND